MGFFLKSQHSVKQQDVSLPDNPEEKNNVKYVNLNNCFMPLH